MSKNLLWDAALARLKEGNDRFVKEQTEGKKQALNRRQELTKGQAPWAIILSCADSRVVPELTFDTGLGELFVIRVAGNIANKATLASIEYAVAHLDVNLIVVMGHESCGAVTAAMAEGDAESNNLKHLLDYIQPAIAACPQAQNVNEVVKKNAELTAEALAANSAIIQNEITHGELKVFSAYYNLSDGHVDVFEEA